MDRIKNPTDDEADEGEGTDGGDGGADFSGSDNLECGYIIYVD